MLIANGLNLFDKNFAQIYTGRSRLATNLQSVLLQQLQFLCKVMDMLETLKPSKVDICNFMLT